MTTTIDVRLAVQAISRKGHAVTLERIAKRCGEQAEVEERVLAMLRRGELRLETTESYIAVKGVVPSSWREERADQERIRKLFGESLNG